MKIENLKKGDILQYWHDAGIKMETAYARVIKVGAVKIKVVSEHGKETWKYPYFFDHKLPFDAESTRSLLREIKPEWLELI